MTPAIAIVGMACRYPDAQSPAELWENVLAQRRAFRRMPTERLNAADYYSSDPEAPDQTYAMTAALIEDYEFDRLRYQVSGSAYRSADLAHWLALDVAARALEDAGFPQARGLPRENTSVYLGNTLTGEFSRAAALRLRWPYVRRVVAASLAGEGWDPARRAVLLRRMESEYKSPFAEVNEETLAGGLSNTIAGRIANHFDLKGGGYTVDGACASSLLAVATACSALAASDCDVALAGGVDLSLDPFELVGFAKAGALAREQMRVFDVRSAGFWPGEGCGFVVLMRRDDALAMAGRVYGLIRGWGISSDGAGGLTRPELEGQLLALQRAYRRAGFAPESVAYYEGHGTGTAVGDATELRALAHARSLSPAAAPAAVGSIKANIGHTKAAAGIAGLLKVAMALDAQVIPPTTGCESPHPEMKTALRAVARAEIWPAELPLRAAVSAMGFGGINSHIVLEGAGGARRACLSDREIQFARTPQDAELFLFSSAARVQQVAEFAAGLSLAEMTDLAALLASQSAGPGCRAVAASTPEELARKLAELPVAERRATPPRIGFLFPGQGSQNSSAATEIAQPAIVRESLEALRELRELGIEACVAIGHSLGELVALCWAGALEETAAVRIAEMRGRLMASVDGPLGAMAGIAAGEQETRVLIQSEPVVIAGLNSARRTVISGEAQALQRVVTQAQARGFHAALLPVSHAFHSPLVAPAAEPLAARLAEEVFAIPRRRVISTVTGEALRKETDLRELLRLQVTAPVLFQRALRAAPEVDLWIEVGPGRALSQLAAETVAAKVFPVESGTHLRRPFLEAVGAAFEMGAPVRSEALFAGRFFRSFRGHRKFFVNPCELAPPLAEGGGTVGIAPPRPHTDERGTPPDRSAMEVVRALVAERAELPLASLQNNARLLADLHLNSIAVAQIAAEAARQLKLPPLAAPLEYAGLSIGELAGALMEMSTAAPGDDSVHPPGVAAWVRNFQTRLVPRALVSSPAQNAPRRGAQLAGPRKWQFFGAVSEELREAPLPSGGGVLLYLPACPDARWEAAMLASARVAVQLRPPARFVVVHHGGGGAALARTVFLEARHLPVCVVDLPEGDSQAVERVVAEASAVRRYSEAHYDAGGVRHEPVWSTVSHQRKPLPLGPDDVLLATGGAKGIGAECAIEAARISGARLAILGTSAPEGNPNLERMRAQGIRCEYIRADVTDGAAVAAAFDRVQRMLGPVTAILHCAGVNQPRSVAELDEAQFRHTIAVKVAGLRHLLAAAGPSVKLAVAFGSIIARTGLPGEAHYAVANEWMARDFARWGEEHPQCRTLTLEWSVWSGAGMGDRLGRLEALKRMGVSPISIEEGVRAFCDALSSDANGAVIVAGRFGAQPTVQFDAPDLPLLRFLERTRVYYPGIELVCEADLSARNDPYLEDHVFEGARLFPGVMALEAMAQAAMAAAGSATPPAFEQVRFARPIIVPPDSALTVRLAALVRQDGAVEVALRSAETSFQTDHFRAVCRFGTGRPTMALNLPEDREPAPVDPVRDLYGGLLFQQGRFRRLRSYLRLQATECIAETAEGEPRHWFNRHLPQKLTLGDPGLRDAAIHAIQACIPHARVLPAGAAKIWAEPPARAAAHRICARERSREGSLLIYDLEIQTLEGEPVECWSGLELRIVGPAESPQRWPAALLAPYLERRIAETTGLDGVSVALRPNGIARGIFRRADGKPLRNGSYVSRSHAGGLTLEVSAAVAVGCDCEPVTPRPPDVWRDLLGADGFALADLVARSAGESQHTAATRVWCALESLKKAGARLDAGIVFSTPEDSTAAAPGWVVLRSGTAQIPTLVAVVSGVDQPLAIAILVAS